MLYISCDKFQLCIHYIQKKKANFQGGARLWQGEANLPRPLNETLILVYIVCMRTSSWYYCVNSRLYVVAE